MTKHLSEFRAFPLFFYGQNYMLGVEAWITVPFFWIGGPTVAMQRLPLVLVNLCVASAIYGSSFSKGFARTMRSSPRFQSLPSRLPFRQT